MQLPKLPDIDVAGKRILLRADLDVPFADGKIEDDTRIQAGLPTIEYLLEKGASQIIIIGHAGRPQGVDKSLSLAPVASWFMQKLVASSQQLEATHLSGFDGWKITDKVSLLENLRFDEGEEKNDPEFSKQLASLADIYIDDAFSVVHREHASIVGVAKLLPHVAGLRLEKEVEVLSNVLENPKRPLVVLIGGSKMETKLPVIRKMTDVADHVLVGGKLPSEHEALIDIDTKKVTVATLSLDETDITAASVEKFIEELGKAQTIVWNGPMGLIKEDALDTEKGTREVAEAIAQSAAYKVVGGGDTLGYLKHLRLAEKFDFVSTGGGAMLDFLAGEKLPGLEALR
jgi:phosphoglycerate kinase